MRLPETYEDARERFLAAARDAGASLREQRHPQRGPSGEVLATDVAVVGRPDAPARLLVVSGTHGVEGFAGSACQTEWLTRGVAAPDDLAVVVVHALNPFGFAWVRRVNEDNVDLNRNFVDFAAPLPENPGYDELADALVPRHLDNPDVRAVADAQLLQFGETRGWDALQDAVSRGQYRHPTGVFFGGGRPVWSRQVLESIVAEHLAGAERIGILDLHTGLGPWGVGEVMAAHPRPDERALLEAWFDEVTVPAEGTSVSADTTGDVLDGVSAAIGPTPVMGVAIEWGTVDMVEVSTALREDAWLHAFDDPAGPQAASIKARLRDAFAPQEAEWARRVWERFDDVSHRTLAGLVS